MKELDLKAHEKGNWQINGNVREMRWQRIWRYILGFEIFSRTYYLVGMIMWQNCSSFFEVLPIHIGELGVWDNDTWSRKEVRIWNKEQLFTWPWAWLVMIPNILADPEDNWNEYKSWMYHNLSYLDINKEKPKLLRRHPSQKLITWCSLACTLIRWLVPKR